MKRLYLIPLFTIFLLSNFIWAQNTDLIILKTGPNSKQRGEDMSYLISIANNGPDNSDGAIFRDTLPAFVSNVVFASCTANGGAVCPGPSDYTLVTETIDGEDRVIFSGNVPTLPKDGEVQMTINLRSPNGFYSGASFSNTAHVYPPSGKTDTDLSTNSSTWNVILTTTGFDIEVLKSNTPMGALGDCSTLPQTIEYTVEWVNKGPDAADGVGLHDFICFQNRNYTLTGSGNHTATFDWPWSIHDIQWSSSGTGSSTPSSTFDNLSGTTRLTSNSCNLLSTLGSTVIDTWNAGDTLRLTYNLTIQSPTVSGCGRDISFDVNNRAYFNIPISNYYLTELNNADNIADATNSLSCSTDPCPVTDIEVLKSNSPSGSLGDCSSLPQTIDFVIEWVNKGPDPADGAQISDYICFQNRTYTNTGTGDHNALYNWPWSISNMEWYTSSPSTSLPSSIFPNTTGSTNLPSNYCNSISSLPATTIDSWAVGDTIRLTYSLTIAQPSITGCGRDISFDIFNRASSSIPSGSDLSDINSSNNFSSTTNSLSCTTPVCEDPQTDIEVIKSNTPSGDLGDCSTLPQSIEYTIEWVNHGPYAADGVQIYDYLCFQNRAYTYTGTGDHTATFDWPWSITDFDWYTSSSNTTIPTNTFPNTSGSTTLTSNSCNAISSLPATTITNWAVGDTIRLTYNLTIQQPIINGCGRNITFDIFNRAYFSIPSNIDLTDTDNTNNIADVTNSLGCTTPACPDPETDIEVRKTNTPSGSLGDCSNLPQTIEYTIEWINNGPDSADGVQINDYLCLQNRAYTYPGTGSHTATYDWPWSISNFEWYVSGSGTSTPSSTFPSLSGTKRLTSNYCNSLATLPSTTIDNWASGDTIRLTYHLTIQQPIINGCGRNITFDVFNRAYFTIPGSIDLRDTDNTNNSADVINSISCTAPVCPVADIEVTKASSPRYEGCSTLPSAIDYTIEWINKGPDNADGVIIQDYVSFQNPSYSGTGNATFEYPWNISDVNWYVSSNDTSIPTGTFNNLSGSKTPTTSFGTISTLSTPGITEWASGDTIRLSYTLNIDLPIITGCERNIDFDIFNRAYFTIPSGSELSDNNNTNNFASVTDNASSSAVDLSISKSLSPAIVDHLDSIEMSIVFQNATVGSFGNNVYWTDTLPTTLNINPSTIVCTASGGATCPTISYDPVTRVLRQDFNSIPGGGSVTITFKAEAYSIETASQNTSANAFNCADCIPETNFTDQNFQINGIVTPVELLYFDYFEDDCKINFEWATASEQNFSHFELQHSTDGQRFKTIEKIQGSNNTTASTFYKSRILELIGGSNYFRLKQIDIDESFKYSDILSIKSICNKRSVQVFPNPIQSQHTVNLVYQTIERENIKVYVSNIFGENIYQNEFNVQAGNNPLKLNIANYPVGTYLIHINNQSGFISNHKLIKQN